LFVTFIYVYVAYAFTFVGSVAPRLRLRYRVGYVVVVTFVVARLLTRLFTFGYRLVDFGYARWLLPVYGYYFGCFARLILRLLRFGCCVVPTVTRLRCRTLLIC